MFGRAEAPHDAAAPALVPALKVPATVLAGGPKNVPPIVPLGEVLSRAGGVEATYAA